MTTPKCRRCGKPCEYYGEIGGFSVQCHPCNKEKNRKARAASARRREAMTPRRKRTKAKADWRESCRQIRRIIEDVYEHTNTSMYTVPDRKIYRLAKTGRPTRKGK